MYAESLLNVYRPHRAWEDICTIKEGCNSAYLHGGIFYTLLTPFLRAVQQEIRAVGRKPRDAAALLFGLKFAGRQHSLQA